jgi:hypothetical protein
MGERLVAQRRAIVRHVLLVDGWTPVTDRIHQTLCGERNQRWGISGPFIHPLVVSCD